MTKWVLGALQGPAAGLILASLGSLVFCATSAPQKNRNVFVWAVKGLLGGPLTIRSLQESEALLTQAQQAERKQQ